MEKLDLYEMLKELPDDKLIKFAKKIGNLYRKFPEYSNWSQNIKENYTHCQSCGREFIEGIIEKEVHHEPETLTDIVFNVLLDYIDKEKPFSTIDVINTVNNLHYEGLVGYKVWCSCCHKIHHLSQKANK